MSDERPSALLDEPVLPVRRGDVHADDPGRVAVDVLPQLRRADLVANGYAALLSRVSWHQFWTLTFRANRGGRNGGMHAEAADKAFRFFVSSINRKLYGANWSRRWHGGIQWARGQEFHRDGRLHFHAVASAPTDDLNRLISRYEWHEFWFREFGRNRIEAPRSQLDVSGYVSKYVTKDGEVDFSGNFGAWAPPPIDYSVRPEQDALIAGDQEHRDHPADRCKHRAG